MTTPDRERDQPLWTAIAEPTRQQLLDLILSHGAITASALARALPITRQAIAKHLVMLEQAGLVHSTRHGRELRYAIDHDRLNQATQQMSEILATWNRRLVTIKHLAETEAKAAADEKAGAPTTGKRRR